ncbi:MAG TPA: SGNH/GDSL hydrolase family protein [Ignavibacteria bacterium]|nr:SGNH/GDSL hydrolase family protein [Ignavibacteria bacterium]
MSIRTWAYFFRGEYERYDVDSGTFVLIPGKHKIGRSILNVNSDGFVGNELKKQNDKLYRILALGDSVTFGDGDMYTTYPALLEQDLNRTPLKGVEYEVVNGGVEGLNSEMALKRLKSKGPGLKPDIVTIYIGWNDLMKFDPTSQGNVKKWSGLARALDKLWLAKGVRKLVFFYIRPNLNSPGVGKNSSKGLFKDFVPTFYEDNLRKLINTTRSIGAKPLVMTLPTVIRKNMQLSDLKEANVVFPYYPSAYNVYDLLDMISSYNKSIRRIAAEKNVKIIDLESAFSKLKNTKPYFYDTMHTSKKGRKLIANEINKALKENNLL